jgi:hypothetical protein
MRAVHDILRSTTHAMVVVSFIQHGEQGSFFYENICPWCGETVGELIPAPPEGADYGWLLNTLREGMVGHLASCTAGGWKLRVYTTKVPLGTENPPKVM